MTTVVNATTISVLQGLTPMAGDVAVLDGYAAAGDGGGGSFCFDGSPPSSAQITMTSGQNVSISNVTNTTPIQITTTAHGYASGQGVSISGTGVADGTWIVTVLSTTTFTLNGSTLNGTASTGTATPALGVLAATNATPILVTTKGPHGYVTGQCVNIVNATGNTAANGTWIVTASTYAVLFALTTNSTLTTVATNTLAVGQIVSFGGTGTLPTGLSPATAYYVVTAGGTSFQVATTPGGTVVPLTTWLTGAVTVSVASNTISLPITVGTTLTTASAHGFIAGQAIVFAVTNGGTLPSGISTTPGTPYYVLSPSGNTFQIATSPGGAAVTLGTLGTGTGTLAVTSVSTFTLDWSSGSGAYTGSATVNTITLTTNGAHGLAPIQPVMIAGVLGNTAANTGAVVAVATALDSTHLSIGAASTGAWTSGGFIGDGGTSIPSSAASPPGGRWRRIFSGAVDVRWFGATGNGTTDDSVALQAAISALPGVGGEILLAQGGSFTMGSTAGPSLGSSLRVDKPLSVVLQAGASLNGVSINNAYYATGISPLFSVRAAARPGNFSLTGADPQSSSITAAHTGTIFQLAGDFISWDGDGKSCCAIRGVQLNGATSLLVSGASGTPIQITTTVPHGYVSGQAVDVEYVGGNTNANGVWIVTVTGATTFTLNGSSSGPASYTANTGTATDGGAFTLDVTGATDWSGLPVQITTSTPHGYATGDNVVVSGIQGNTLANGTWSVVVDGCTVSSVSVTASTLTASFPLVAGEAVTMSSSVSLPAPLVANVTYYVTNPVDPPAASPYTFQLAAARGGPAIALASVGSGTITVTTLDAFTLKWPAGTPLSGTLLNGTSAHPYLVGGTVSNGASSMMLDTSGGAPLLQFEDGMLLVEDCVVTNFGGAAVRIGPSVWFVRVERTYFINNYSALYLDNNAEASIAESWFTQSWYGAQSITSIGPMHRIVHNYFLRRGVGAPSHAPDILLVPQGAWSDQSGGYVWILDNRFAGETENLDARRTRIRLGTLPSTLPAGPAIVKGNQFFGSGTPVVDVMASGGTATVTLGTSNGASPTQGLVVGSLVTLSGISLGAFNGTFTVTGYGANPLTQFTFALGGTVSSTAVLGLAIPANSHAISLENPSLPWDLSGNYFAGYGVLVNDAQPPLAGGSDGSLFLDNRVSPPDGGYQVFANEGRAFGVGRIPGGASIASWSQDPRPSETRALQNRMPASEALGLWYVNNGLTVAGGQTDPYGTSRAFLLSLGGSIQNENIAQVIDTTTSPVLNVSGASGTSPIVITTTVPYGHASGQTVVVTDTTGAKTTWVITVPSYTITHVDYTVGVNGTFTVSSATPAVGQGLSFTSSSAGGVPAPLVAGQTYFVASTSGSTFQLTTALTGNGLGAITATSTTTFSLDDSTAGSATNMPGGTVVGSLAQNSRLVVKFWAKAGTLTSLVVALWDFTRQVAVGELRTISLGPDWKQYKFVTNGLPVLTDTYELLFYPGSYDLVSGDVYLFAPQVSDVDSDYLPNNNAPTVPAVQVEDTSAGNRFEKAVVLTSVKTSTHDGTTSTGPTATTATGCTAAIEAGSTDHAGAIILTMGAATSSGTVTVAYNQPYVGAASPIVVVTPQTGTSGGANGSWAASAPFSVSVLSSSTTGFQVGWNCGSNLAASTSYDLGYVVVGRA